MRELVEQRHRATRGLLAEVDHIVAVCEWVRDVLHSEWSACEEDHVCRQGIEFGDERDASSSEEPTARREDGKMRARSVSRADFPKNVHCAWFIWAGLIQPRVCMS